MKSFKKLCPPLKTFLLIVSILAIVVIVLLIFQKNFSQQKFISGDSMMAIIDRQLRFGPRFLGAIGHEETKNFLIAEMNSLAKETKVQTWQHTGPDGQKYDLTNVIGRFYPDNKNRVILATHYDSKKFADQDPEKKDQPVPGANDSASGVAALLELASIFNKSHNLPSVGLDIVFFDGEEEGGDFANWKPLGSTYFAEHLIDIYGNSKPISGIVLDMVCDKDLKIFKEQSSVQNAPAQVDAFWNIAKKINNNVFRDQTITEIRDDQTPLNKVGIPSFLLIDLEYLPWHTTNDTLDKCSPKSLDIIVAAVLNYIYSTR